MKKCEKSDENPFLQRMNHTRDNGEYEQDNSLKDRNLITQTQKFRFDSLHPSYDYTSRQRCELNRHCGEVNVKLPHLFMIVHSTSLPSSPSTSSPSREVIQEGWYFIASHQTKNSSSQKTAVLSECWYQIYSDGILAFRMNTNLIHKLSIQLIQFKLYDASSSLSTGCGLMLAYPKKGNEGDENHLLEEFYFIFDHILDLKRFCFGCYRTTKGTNLHEIMAKMKWLKESAELVIDSLPKKKSSVKSYLQSFVRVSDSASPRSNPKPDAIQNWPSVDSNQPDTHTYFPQHHSPTSQRNFDYDKIFRRLSSRTSDRSPSLKASEDDATPVTTTASRTNFLTPAFVSPVLYRVPHETVAFAQETKRTRTDQLFWNGIVQLFPSGTLIVNYESLLDDQNDLRKLSQSYTCRKVLCSKYQPNPDQTTSVPLASHEEDPDGISQVALQLRIYTGASEGENPVRRVTPITHSPKKINRKKQFDSDNFTEIILIYPSLSVAKSFLFALSTIVPVHNILGFLVEMDWIGNQLQADHQHHQHEGVMKSLERTESDGLENEIDHPRVQLEVCIPETIEEEEGEDSGEKSIVDIVESKENNLAANPTSAPSFTRRILRQLSSKDSYSGLDNAEGEPEADIENNLNLSSPTFASGGPGGPATTPPRRSRLSHLFGLDFSRKESLEGGDGTGAGASTSATPASSKVKSIFFANFTSDSNKSILDDSETMSEKFPGFKCRSQSQLWNHTNETNLSIIGEEMDDIPPQQVAPGRFTTLKQILGQHNDQDGTSLKSSPTASAGEMKGVKGTKTDLVMSENGNGLNNANHHSARAREKCPDGIGAIIGGVLFEKLVVKRNEFSPRLLEVRLREILPLISWKNEKISTTTPLNTNKITPFHEFAMLDAAGNQQQQQQFLSYDGHLILDGVDFSRDKHVEILIRVVDLPIEKSVELLQGWVSNSIENAGLDIPDHWEDFVANNILLFSQKVKELKDYSHPHSSSSSAVPSSGSFGHLPPSPRHGPGIQSKSRSHDARKDELQHIQHLDLRYCHITNRGVALLVDSLRKNNSLLSLNLTGNSISHDSAAASLGNMLNFNFSLVEVNLQETNLGNTGATLVAQALHINMSLEKLSLSGNNITAVGCAMLSMALEENTTLLQLNLSRNNIGVDGTKWIAKALYTNKSLTCLDLNRQHLKGKIGSDGSKYLSRCLRMNNTLRILRIGRNRIGFEGARYLSGMLLLNRGLRILDLSHSKIGVEGAIQLANALIQNNSLQSMLLANRLLPVCYLKGVHDSDYYLTSESHKQTRFTLDKTTAPSPLAPSPSVADLCVADISVVALTSRTDSSPMTTPRSFSFSNDNSSSHDSFAPPSYSLDDDIYNGDNPRELNCDIAYDCQEKSFEKIDLQVLFSSSLQATQLYSTNIEEWPSDTFSNSFGRSSTNKPENSDVESRARGCSSSDRNSTTRVIRPLAITDEESVLIAHLLRGNNLLQELRLEHTFLPIQLLRGRSLTTHCGGHPPLPSHSPSPTSTPRDPTGNGDVPIVSMSPVIASSHMYSLDLSDSNLVSSDATVVGVLIAENPYLRTICLKGNYFNKTDGETWIANAINKNPNVCLDTNIWSAEEMFADGYHQLAALKGVSVSGAAIEPQRLDTIWDKLFIVLSCLGYYVDVSSDIYVTYLYSQNPELKNFVPWTAMIISLPTVMTMGSILWTTFLKHPCRGTLQMLIVLFQLHPLIHVYESILMEIETTALLDAKFLEGIYEAIPQILLQTYIMFLLSVSSGSFQFPIFFSLLISMLTVSGVLVMVVDRGKVRQITLGPRRKNPWFVRYLAHGIAVLFEGENLCSTNKFGLKSHEGMKELIHYSSYTYSHYCWAVLFHFSTLVVRLIAITWLLVVVGPYKFVVFLIIFCSRALLIFFLDPKTKRRSTLRNLVWCLCYCLITGVWDKDERSPVASRRAYLLLNILDTVESTIFICYAAFLSKNSQMRMIHGLLTFAAVIICRALSWILILSWQLPVHYTELQTEDKLKSSSSCYDLAMFRLCSWDTHTFFDDVVSRVDTPVIPEVFYTNGEKKSSISNGKVTRPKSWWSAEERSATMELSYLTAVVDSKLVLLSTPQGVEIKQSPLGTPRDAGADGGSGEGDGGGSVSGSPGRGARADGGRERSHARDWDAKPEVMQKMKGRFQLKGGKNVYTDTDLAKNLERHRALSRKTRRGFSGWSRHTTPAAAAAASVAAPAVPNEAATRAGTGAAVAELQASSGDSENASLLDPRSAEQQRQQSGGQGSRADSPHRRGTALLDYHDFIPAKRPDKLSLQLSHLQLDDSETKDQDHREELLHPSILPLRPGHHPRSVLSNSSPAPHLRNPVVHNPQGEGAGETAAPDDDDDMVWEVNPSRTTLSSKLT